MRITVTVNYDPEDLEGLGYFELEATEKSYIVEGVTEYINLAIKDPRVSLSIQEEIYRVLSATKQPSSVISQITEDG